MTNITVWFMALTILKLEQVWEEVQSTRTAPSTHSAPPSGQDPPLERLSSSAEGYAKSVEEYLQRLEDISDIKTKWKSLKIARATVDAWIIDLSDSNKNFTEAVEQRIRKTDKIIADARRLGSQKVVIDTRQIQANLKRSLTISANLLRNFLKIRAKLEKTFREVDAALPPEEKVRQPLKARRSAIPFDQAVSDVMGSTSVTREYLAR